MWNKRIICIILVILLVVLSACNKPSEPTDESNKGTETMPPITLDVDDFTMPVAEDGIIFENDSYTAERKNNRIYVAIKNFVPPAPIGCHPTEDGRVLCCDGEIPVVGDTFSSVDSFTDAVCVTGLSEEQVKGIAYRADAQGVVEVYDPSRVYIPVFPDGPLWDGAVAWYGNKAYGCVLKTDIKYYEEDIYFKVSPFKNTLSERLAEIPEETYDDPEREGGICYGEQFEEGHYSNAKYEFSSKGISYTVFEKYYNVRNIPYKIDLYGSIGDVDFHYEISIRTFEYEEKPDKEWLEQFYLKLYEK